MSYLSRVSYLNIAGGQTVFPVTFPYLSKDHVGVYLCAAGGNPLTAPQLVSGVDYTWTSAGVITMAATHNGSDVHLRRNTPSAVDSLSGGTLSSEAQNRIDTQLLYIVQEQGDAAVYAQTTLESRALVVPVGETVGTLPAKLARANSYQAWDEDGNPVAGPQVAAVGPVAAAVDSINTVASAITDVINLSGGLASVSLVADNLAAVIAAGAAAAREYVLVCSDETTALSAGVSKFTWPIPRSLALTGVRASLSTAQASGALLTVDIKVDGSSVLGTKLTIDNTEKSSKTASTPPTISNVEAPDGSEVTVDISQIGDGSAKGLKVTLFAVPALIAGPLYSADFTGGLLSGVTLARSSAGTYVNSSGNLASAAVDTARFDYRTLGVYAASPPSLLLERASTNYLLQSATLTNAAWATNVVTVATSAQLAPDGVATMFKVAESAGTATHFITQTFNLSAGSNLPGCLSIFMKQVERRYAWVRVTYGTVHRFVVVFDLQTGLATANTGTNSFTFLKYGCEVWPGGIVRPWICAREISSNVIADFGLSDTATPTFSGANVSYAGVAGNGVYMWGAQYEQANSPSAPITTTTAAVARAADVATATVSAGVNRLRYRFDDGSFQWGRVNPGANVLSTTLNRPNLARIDGYADNYVANMVAFAAGGGQPANMGTSPTITAGSSGASPTLTGPLVAWDQRGAFALLGGVWATSNPKFATASTVKRSVDNTVRSGQSGAIEFIYDKASFEVFVRGNGQAFRLYVDGLLSTNVIPTTGTSGQEYFHKVTFASAASRLIRIEQGGGSLLEFAGIVTEPGATVTAPSYQHRFLAVGDSFTEAPGGATATSYACQIGRELGLKDAWVSGSGATGWMQSYAGAPSLDGRWTEDVLSKCPSILTIAMGINDDFATNGAAITTIIQTRLAELRAVNPTCLVHVFGVWDNQAPGAPAANCVTGNTVLAAACAGLPNVWFHSMQGVAYANFDGVHPSQAGHDTLATYCYDQIAAVHGLRTR